MTKQKESDLTGLSDWIFGPDKELLTNPKTRLSTALFIVLGSLFVVSRFILPPGFPYSFIPLGLLLSSLFFGIWTYRKTDELIKSVTRNALSLTLLELLVLAGIYQALQSLKLIEMSVDRFFVATLVLFFLNMITVFKSKT